MCFVVQQNQNKENLFSDKSKRSCDKMSNCIPKNGDNHTANNFTGFLKGRERVQVKVLNRPNNM